MGSPIETLDHNDIKKWETNLITFLAPVLIIYLSVTIGVLSIPTHTFSFWDLVPNQFTLGSMVLYLLNSFLDLFKKYLTNNP